MTFGDDLLQHVPILERYARKLTRNHDESRDLVQATLCRALAKQALFQPGSNLRAWLTCILHNEHVNQVRKGIQRNEIRDAFRQTTLQPRQEACVFAREIVEAVRNLPPHHRPIVQMIADRVPYEDVGRILNIPVGTVRSRVNRARDHLRALSRAEAP